ncbi:CD2-associated protein-like [Chrysoperla carnea]|uniref:CD2-associated protein-like n=1 Tax=Chrysoperla carnea TaxID=189513 RepID=UPI001D06A288|nr:CD2-associated protein-like [Chrysoperla carnea]
MVEAIVDFDYEAQEPDELTIRKGDILRNITKKPGGWWEGTLNDKRGMFPDNFVHVLDSDVVLRNKSTKEKRMCQAVFSYVPEHEDELRLNVGDVIEVLGEIEEGWWRGRLNDKEGVFPSNFVEDISIPTPHTNSKSKFKVSKEDLTSISNDTEISSHVPSLPPKPVKIICQAMFAYKAQNDDELTLKVGDLITLISKDGQDKGWWRGELRGRIGVFPDNFVNVIPVPVDTTNSNSQPSALNLLTQTTPPTAAKKITDKLPPQVAKISPQSIPPKKETTPPKTIPVGVSTPMTTPPSSTVAMQRKSLEAKSEVPPIPGKKPAVPMKKSPSLTGGGILSGLKQKVMGSSHDSTPHKTASNDNLDGICSSRLSKDEITPLSYTATSGDEKQDEFDRVERSSMLTDPRANRAKAPGRRPPSMVIRDLDQPGLTNGNAEHHTPTSNSSPPSTTTTPLQQIPDENEQSTPECKPKPRDWEKHRVPWMDELKLNQAKKTSPLNPSPESSTRLKFSSEKLNEDTEDKDCMSKSMSAAIRLRTPTPPGEKPGVMLRNRNSINQIVGTSVVVRPQSIHGGEIDQGKVTREASTRNLTPSPVLKPPTGVVNSASTTDIHNKPSGDRKSLVDTTSSASGVHSPGVSGGVGYVTLKQYNELEDKVHLLEVALDKQNQLFNTKLDEILQKVHNEIGDLRQQIKTIEKSVDKLAQCVTQV